MVKPLFILSLTQLFFQIHNIKSLIKIIAYFSEISEKCPASCPKGNDTY